ncbi:hypothetical protein UPYG_G00064770 [Umbra pygmaea]|uniref:Inositol 1,4,5-trisphosphate receptor-interacting protein n=1 Tax=Umbra pygmaea TaxID=75934 RepID=A0ABD0XA58_UMBPY
MNEEDYYYAPKPKHLRPARLLRVLGSSFDPFWMSIERPAEAGVWTSKTGSIHTESSDGPTALLNLSVSPELTESAARYQRKLQKDAGDLNFNDLPVDVAKTLRDWLVRSATCGLRYHTSTLPVTYTVLNMQDIILRVFVVTASLLYPTHREEWITFQEDEVLMAMQEREDWLLKQRTKLEQEQEVPLINQEVSPQVILEEAPIKLKSKVELPHKAEILEKNIYQNDPEHAQQDSEEISIKKELTQEKKEAWFQIYYKLSQMHQVDETEQKFSPEDGVKSHTESSQTQEYQEVKLLPTYSSADQQGFTGQQSKSVLTKSLEDSKLQKSGNYIIWCLWNTCSLISLIRLSIRLFRRKSQNNLNPSEVLDVDMEDISALKNLAAEIPLPDSDTLNRFYVKCVKVSSNESWRVREFVEGFANDLLEAMRGVSDTEVGLIIEEFEVVEGGINSLLCDIIVPIVPIEPHCFHFPLWCNQNIGDDMPLLGCGRVKLVCGTVSQNGCPCRTAAVKDDDMLCLLCCGKENVQKEPDVNRLCSNNTPYLAKTHVTKWFQAAIRKAWGQISHKYEFELRLCNMDNAGAMAVRFRSGKVIKFDMRPVVKLNDTEAYFTTASYSNTTLETNWAISLATYENHFFKYLTNRLPENTCHIHCFEITALLHKKQMELTGRSDIILKDYHLKTAWMHLLLRNKPLEWDAGYLSDRLRDVLGLLEKSLQSRTLHHSFIGNPLVPADIELPAFFTEAKPVNLFHPLLVQRGNYTKTLKHLQEMLRNSCMLVQEYVDH